MNSGSFETGERRTLPENCPHGNPKAVSFKMFVTSKASCIHMSTCIFKGTLLCITHFTSVFFPIICVSMLRKIQIFFSCWLHFSESVCLNLQFWISAICNVTKSSGASDNSLRSLAPPAVRCLIQPLRIPQSLLFSSKREAYNKTSVLTLLFYTKLLQSCCFFI